MKRGTMMGALLGAAVMIAAGPASAKPAAVRRAPAAAKKAAPAKASVSVKTSAKASAKARYRRVQRMSFLGSEVEAGVQRPDGTIVGDRAPARMGTMNLVRATFVRELIKSGEDI